MCMANPTRTFLGASIGFALWLGAGVALADDALPDVSRLVREMRYEEALERIEQIRRDPGSAPLVKLRALELAALAHLGLGHDAEARQAFTRMLTVDPGAELTEQRPSPRIVELFQSVRETLAGEEPRAGLVTTLDVPTLEGSPVTAAARPDGEHAIMRVVFRARVGGRETDIQGSRTGPPWRAEIPVATRADLGGMSVVARGFAPSGRLSAVSSAARPDAGGGGGIDDGGGEDSGREGDPYGIRDTPTEDGAGGGGGGGITGKWWFWGAVGAVVVGGTVTAIVLASSGGTEAREGDLGTLQLAPAPAD